MTQTAHLSLRDALVATLQSAPALAGGRIVANRRHPMAAQDDSRIFVYLDESTASLYTVSTINWSTRIRVDCAARASTGVTAEAAADALCQAAYARIMADPGMGALAMDTEPVALAWAEDELDTTVVVCQQIWNLSHNTTASAI